MTRRGAGLQSRQQVESAERVLSAGTWAITAGAVLFSVLTVTPLMQAHTPAGWRWTAPILPLTVDAAVVIVVRLDATLARLGGDGGRWPVVLRWLTGLATLALNVSMSVLDRDRVGMGVHSVAPLLLIVTSEAGLAYRRAIAAALARIDGEQAAEAERERADRAAREQAARAERERAAAAEREAERAEREHAAALERERREHAAALAREEREHADRVRREQQAREDARADAERERAEAAALAERERRERVALARVHHTRPELPTSPRAAIESPVEVVKLSEDEALATVRAGARAGASVRVLTAQTGWSLGWVAARLREAREHLDAAPERSA